MRKFIILCILSSIFGIISGTINGIKDKQINKIENIVEEIAVEEIKIIEEPKVENVYQICDADRELIIKLVYLEARGECYEGKKAVASIVFNRLNSGHWGNTIHDVIYAKNQFTPAKRINSTYIDLANKTWVECVNAVDEVIVYGNIFPEYILYFRADYYFSWANDYKNIGNHYFSYLNKDYNKYIDRFDIK